MELFRAIGDLVFAEGVDAETFLMSAYSILRKGMEPFPAVNLWMDCPPRLYGFRDVSGEAMTLSWDINTPREHTGTLGVDVLKELGAEGAARFLDRWRQDLDIVAHIIAMSLARINDINSARAMKEKLLFLARAIEQLEQAVVITNLDSEILEVNEAFLEFYGYRREEVIGKRPRMVNPGKQVYADLGYSEKDYDEIFKGMWRDLKDPEKGIWKGTVVNRAKDGRLIWVNLVVDAIHDDVGVSLGYVGMPVDISERVNREKASKFELISTIAALADLRDNETGNHMKRVGIFAKAMAVNMGLPKKYGEDLQLFAPMHDIGKVGILDSILRAERSLTEAEFEEMKKHTILGHNIVKGKRELELVSFITLHHHERWDGTGYPMGLQGEAIPLSARITAVADVYDALRSKRPYKKPWSHEAAIQEMVAKRGTHFDPTVIDSFVTIAEAVEKIYARLEDA